MKKRVISILLCLVLVLALVLVPSAPPARAIAGIDDALMFWFLATVVGAGAGLTLSYEGLSQQQASAAYASKFDEWQASSSGSGSTLSQWLEGLGVSSDTVNISGSNNGLKVLLGTFIVQGIKDFWSWFNESVLGSSDGTAADGAHAGIGGNFSRSVLFQDLGLVTSFALNNNVYNLVGTAGAVTGGFFAVYSSAYPTRCYVSAVADGPANIILPNGNVRALELNSNTGLYFSGEFLQNFLKTDFSGMPFYLSSDVGIDASSGSFVRYLNNLSSYDLDGQSVTVGYQSGLEEMTYPQDLEDENVESIPYATDVAAEGVGEGTGTGAIPLVDGIPAILNPALEGDLAVEYEDAAENPDSPARPITSPGLADVFPFCLPFDVYHFFQALSASPVAPHFEWEMVIPGIIDYTWEIDLSGFNSVAQILRTLELLAFCVGLAFVTRSMFIRG